MKVIPPAPCAGVFMYIPSSLGSPLSGDDDSGFLGERFPTGRLDRDPDDGDWSPLPCCEAGLEACPGCRRREFSDRGVCFGLSCCANSEFGSEFSEFSRVPSRGRAFGAVKEGATSGGGGGMTAPSLNEYLDTVVGTSREMVSSMLLSDFGRSARTIVGGSGFRPSSDFALCRDGPVLDLNRIGGGLGVHCSSRGCP